MNPTFKLRFILLLLASSVSCGGGGGLGEVNGRVAVDGTPVDAGTIHFRPTDQPKGRSAGAAITAGEFKLGAAHGLNPGKYAVTVQAARSTGKIVKDPQRGEIPVLQPLELNDSPKVFELTGENAGSVELSFTSER